MRMLLRCMTVRVHMNVIAMRVVMRVNCRISRTGNRTEEAPYIEEPEQDQHRSNGQFHAQSDTWRNN